MSDFYEYSYIICYLALAVLSLLLAFKRTKWMMLIPTLFFLYESIYIMIANNEAPSYVRGSGSGAEGAAKGAFAWLYNIGYSHYEIIAPILFLMSVIVLFITFMRSE